MKFDSYNLQVGSVWSGVSIFTGYLQTRVNGFVAELTWDGKGPASIRRIIIYLINHSFQPVRIQIVEYV